MWKNRLGCLTGTGVIAALITLLAIAGIGLVQGGSLFSPGALNAQQTGAILGNVHSHAELDGNCRACHTAPWEPTNMADRCTACHADITTQMRLVATLHGQLAHESPAISACYDCHPDHRGATASLVDLNGQRFPHEGLGYSLKGHTQNINGAAFICQDCHTVDIKTFDPATCVGCHAQIDLAFMQSHLAAYGPKCLGCHDGVDRFSNPFNHAAFAFPLTGKHASVPCEKCHNHALSLADFATAPKNCGSCHKQNDPHEGQFVQDCSACHSSAGWTPANFDHNQATFKLTGAHVNVACAQCHINGVFKSTPTDCKSCHKQNDPHNGQFLQDCSACHSSTGWRPANFDHNLASFKLTGAHVNVSCTQCHVNGVFKATPADCYSCHKQNDPHNGQFGQDCSICHSTSGWTPATFDHNLAVFKLTGAHINVACAKCHINGVFKGTPTDCYSCHKQNDPHNGQFGTDCSACHKTTAWNAVTFDHNKSNFPLTGAHANVPCAKCHASGKFQGLSTTCVSCHQDPAFHAGIFGTGCATCHTTTAWSPAQFNRSHPNFGEEGGVNHGGATCRTCHPKSVTTFTCLACHDSNNPGGN